MGLFFLFCFVFWELEVQTEKIKERSIALCDRYALTGEALAAAAVTRWQTEMGCPSLATCDLIVLPAERWAALSLQLVADSCL